MVDAADSLNSRLGFIGLDADALERVGSLRPIIERHLDAALSRFYEHIAKVPSVAKFFSNPEHMQHAKARQARHWSAIAAGHLDAAYEQSANVVGKVHARIGLEPRWYIGGYGLIVETLVEGVLKDFMGELFSGSGVFGPRRYTGKEIEAAVLEAGKDLSALLKAVLIDVDLAVSTYFDGITAETRDINTQIGETVTRADAGDFSGRVSVQSSSQAMAELAAGVNRLMSAVDTGVTATAAALAGFAKTDLTGRMEGEFRGAFAQLQSDLNSVGDVLSETIGQVRSSSRALKSATSEILSGANDLAERTTRQAAAVEETAAAMDQLAGTVNENNGRATEATAQSSAVSDTARETGEVMRQANDAMERISTSSAKISSIIGMIDDIAFQTNLLALNASVEAARAGDAGKGFAVVAVEVRRLAQSAASASSEVKSLIEQSSGEVASGTRLVAAASEKLHDMLGRMEESQQLVRAISEATQAQAATISAVATAIRQIDEMTQHNASLVEETNAAIEQTEEQANHLDTIVGTFVTAESKPAAVATSRPAGRYRVEGNLALKD